jgi:hypothetical protein
VQECKQFSSTALHPKPLCSIEHHVISSKPDDSQDSSMNHIHQTIPFLLFHQPDVSTIVVEGKLKSKTLLISDHMLKATTQSQKRC